MTMDVNSQKLDIKCESQVSSEHTVPIVKTKRPFDVAFLMMPDEKLKQKRKKLEDPSEGSECPSFQRYFASKQQIFDDPNLIKARNLDELRGDRSGSDRMGETRSAFTKVSLGFHQDTRLSPGLSLSPDPSYQQSLSPSPPMKTYQTFHGNLLTANQMFKAQINGLEAFPCMDNSILKIPPTTTNSPETAFVKVRPGSYRPSSASIPSELSYTYAATQPESLTRFTPAASILGSLLPPSLAALSLPAQNVCAKCNVSFRMTSDLVYHMRSHHKNETTDSTRRRREDKLRCPVCQETFRERHHLTRHMTAHQDKEEDGEDVAITKK